MRERKKIQERRRGRGEMERKTRRQGEDSRRGEKVKKRRKKTGEEKRGGGEWSRERRGKDGRGRGGGERSLSRLKMTRWESAAASFFPLTVREGDGDYVTRAPPPACCTHPAVQTHTHIKRTLTLADVTDKDVFQVDKNTDEKQRTVS